MEGKLHLMRVQRSDGTVMNHLKRVPVNNEIPDGHVLVHNHVRPTRRLGSRGFRVWTQVPTDRLVARNCGWAPVLGAHCRVCRDGDP